MALTGVNDEHPAVACGLEHGGDRFDGGCKPRHVVAKRLTEATRLHEIALHIDDDERSHRPIEFNRLRFRDYDTVSWLLCSCHPLRPPGQENSETRKAKPQGKVKQSPC